MVHSRWVLGNALIANYASNTTCLLDAPPSLPILSYPFSTLGRIMVYGGRFVVCKSKPDLEMESSCLSRTGTLQVEDEDRSQNSKYNSAKTSKKFSDKVTNFIHQMMFVSGETAEPSIETTTLIEDIVRQQVVEIVCPSAHLTVNMY